MAIGEKGWIGQLGIGGRADFLQLSRFDNEQIVRLKVDAVRRIHQRQLDGDLRVVEGRERKMHPGACRDVRSANDPTCLERFSREAMRRFAVRIANLRNVHHTPVDADGRRADGNGEKHERGEGGASRHGWNGGGVPLPQRDRQTDKLGADDRRGEAVSVPPVRQVGRRDAGYAR